jgi:hypothetical protein
MTKSVYGLGLLLALCANAGIGGCAQPHSIPSAAASLTAHQPKAALGEKGMAHGYRTASVGGQPGRDNSGESLYGKGVQEPGIAFATAELKKVGTLERLSAELNLPQIKPITVEEEEEEEEAEDAPPGERVRELLEKLEDEHLDDMEELSPRERAKRLLELEEAEEMVEELPLEAIEEVQWKDRVSHLLGVYGEAVGIYDEILDVVFPGIGSAARRAGLPHWLIFGGEHRTRFEYLNGQYQGGLPVVDRQIAQRSRLFFAIKDILDPVRFTFELQDSRAHLSRADFTTTFVNKIDIQQLHVDLVFPDFLRTGLPSEIHAGRVNMDLGQARWVARNNFRNTTNAYDGIYWRFGDPRVFHADSFAVRPVSREMDAFDPFFDDNPNSLWGTYALLPPLKALPWLRTELTYHGHRSRGPFRDFEMLGYRFFKLGAAKQWQFEVESQYQFGDISELANFAYFQHGEIGYTAKLPWKPQFLLKFDYASPGFDVLYGRRSFEWAPTGITGPFHRSNLASIGYRVKVKPTEHSYVFVQYRASWLADATAPWFGANLQDPTGEAGSFLGHSVEIRWRAQVMENVFIQAGYFHMAYGSFPRKAPGSPVDRDQNFAYFWTEFMF